MYLVSACLAGFNTRYDGTNCLDERVRKLVSSGMALPVCPEQLGGLPTPRPPVEFSSGDGSSVLDGTGGVCMAAEGSGLPPDPEAFKAALVRGAQETLRMARAYGIKKAILKDGSPSCGTGYVHCRENCGGHCRVREEAGTFGSGKRPGRGVTAELLWREGIEVAGVDSLQG